MANKIILAAVDLQHEASDKHIAAEALALAQTHDADIHLVFVVPDEQNSYVQAYIPAEMRANVNKDAENDLVAFAASLETGGIKTQTHALRGVIYDQIVQLSDKINADFVVVGAHKPGFLDFFMGPNATRVARHAKCSVLIVRPGR
jgi:nucleotide-binding universal stress UspA family protein